MYLETDASGTPITGEPQQDGLGAIAQGQLEMSNVDPVRGVDFSDYNPESVRNEQSIGAKCGAGFAGCLQFEALIVVELKSY